MSLDNRQKQYIKKKLRKIPLAEIAADIEVSEDDILEYFKKKWPREKYERFLKGKFEIEVASGGAGASFSFLNFFNENRLVLLFLAALVLVVYANSFGNGFVSDDVAGFLRNENLGKFSSIFGGPMHFSLSAFFQFIAFHIGGLHPFTFRIINILSHIGCIVLIYLLLSLSMNKRVATIAASIFAVHPILTESVSWISGGLYSLYAFFFLLSFLFYLFSKSNKKYFKYAVVFFVLSVLSSEKALALFLVFALYEFSFGNLKYSWRKVMPFFSISFFLLLFYVFKIGSRVSSVESQSYQSSGGMYNPFVQLPVAIGSYLKLIFWPARLTLYQTEMSFSQGQYLILLFIFLVYIGAIFWSWRKNKNVFFWLVFFVITLLPTLTPLKISWIVAERYVYLGTLGIIVVVAMLFDKILKLNENAKMIGYFALLVIVAALSVRTIIRNKDWKSEDTLWIATAQVAPSGQQIHNNLGDVYARQGDMQKAVEEFKKAIEINPNYADAYHNLANTYQQMGQLDLAIENYQKALSINPQLWQSYQNLAAIYFNQGQYDLAEENIKKALEINPGDQNLESALKYIQENRK
ncbi:MAG TPA: tetratricopeptide repeat protein [Candidatus Saccharimonadales bacterium]|nr:tetratricopeptide repeat protein [Candidatus Saccharimonadales bacterium]